MKASDLIRQAHVKLKKRPTSDELVGLSLRMIREFDAEEDRRTSLLRAAEEARLIRLLYLLRVQCSPTVH